MAFDPQAAADTAALPYATPAPEHPIAAEVRARPEDFHVEEIPAYAPSGEGDHLFVRFEKTSLNTPEAVKRIAAVVEVDKRAAGWAGLKDRHAVTEQWASFEHAKAEGLVGAEIEGVRILESKRHNHKLRTGHLRGNRFTLLLRGATPEDAATAEEILSALVERGLPSYFGPQRFGRDGHNVAEAARWIVEGGRPPKPRFRRKLLVSAFQSALFNRLLADRIREGTVASAIDGDLLQKVDSGGLFVCEAPATDSARAAAFEVSPTGPMFGAKMRWPEREALAREEAALADAGLERGDLRRFAKAGAGTRRPYRFAVGDPEVAATPDGVRLEFTLPAGGYATTVLREILRREVR